MFKYALPVVALAFIVSFWLREIPLRDDVNVGSAAIEGMEEAGLGMLGEAGPPGLDDRQNVQPTAAANGSGLG